MARPILLLALLLTACTGSIGGGSIGGRDEPPTPRDGGANPSPGERDASREVDGGEDPEPIDAAVAIDGGAETVDAGSDAGVPTGDSDAGLPPPLTECGGNGSIDRFQSWLASGEGTTIPATGSMLVREGDDYSARIEFVNREWHVLTVFTANRYEGEADFTNASGFWMTYSATDDLYVQIRPSFEWSGGNKYLTRIPSTEGREETRFFPFAEDQWTTLPALGTPSYPYERALAQVRGFVFVGETPNRIVFRGLRVDGYVPSCL